MERGARKRASAALSTSPDQDSKAETGLKGGAPQDLAFSPKLDRYKIARQLAEKAVKEKKIFSIYGHYPVVRAALRKKGWVEKKPYAVPKVMPCVEDKSKGVTDSTGNLEMTFKKAEDIHDVMSRLVKHETPYLLWTVKRDAIDYHSLSGDQMLNHYGKTASFTTKVGLCMSMRSLPWYTQANPDSFFPRCYSLCTPGEKQDFLDDFRRTVASSILRWVVGHQNGQAKSENRCTEASDSDPSNSRDVETAEAKLLTGLPGQLIDTACRVCQSYLGQLEHEDIDVSEDAAESLTEDEWNDLIQKYYSLVHGDAFISNSKNYLSQCQALLNKITSVNPQTEIDGVRNIWIIKPAAKSRGRDIVCMDRVEEILELVAEDQPSAKDNRWVAQKYIETPLLIHDTKFDIRQWFLVTDWNPLTIWFYKESYLRFSTQRFSLDDLGSAIHLCNNSIQKHLQNAKDRSPLLPGYNMWTSTKFREYLQGQGWGTLWGSVIYPSMKRAVINTMKVAQDHVEARKNSFELYGADFILSKDFKPWLIEINSSPTMHPSTPVTAQLCAQVQEDTIKVVLDRRLDRNCDIGNFELLWRQPPVETPPCNRPELRVEGVSFRKANKQASSVSTLNLTLPLSGTQLLRGRCPTPVPDPAPRPLPQDLRLKDKALVRTSLAPLRRRSEQSCAAPDRGPEVGGRIVLPAFCLQCLDLQAARAMVAKAVSPRSPEPNALKAHLLAATLRGRKAAEGSLFQLPRAPGRELRDLAAPCLVCRGPFQPAQPCKRCLSFCAAVLQGTTFVPLGGGQGDLCGL